MRLVLVGPPGCGKGTQAELLVKRLGLTYVGTGEILRDEMRRGTDLGKKIRPLMDQGLLVPDRDVDDVVAELFRGASRPDKFVVDGYPRTYSQAIAFDALLMLQYLNLDAVISLEIEDDEVVRRIGGRRQCSNTTCGTLYNVNSPAKTPKKAGICDKCGSTLAIRVDDKEETIRRRLGEFHKNTDQLIEHYGKRNLLRPVSATDAPEMIYANIVKALGR